MAPEGSLPHSQQLATCTFPEQDQSTPCLPIPLLKEYLIRSTNHGTPLFEVFSGLLLPRLSQAPISPSAPYSQTPSPSVRHYISLQHTTRGKTAKHYISLRIHHQPLIKCERTDTLSPFERAPQLAVRQTCHSRE